MGNLSNDNAVPAKSPIINWHLPVCLVALLLFVVFVWPTRYRYDTTQVHTGFNLLVRTDRLTGRGETFVPGQGWQKQHPQVERDLTEQELQQLEQREFHENGNDLSILIYNGSKLTVTSVVVRQQPKDSNARKKQRGIEYALTLLSNPRQTMRELAADTEPVAFTGKPRNISRYVGRKSEAADDGEWSIVGARGFDAED